MHQDYYAILGVEPTANPTELQAAFLQRAKQCHPDRGGSHEQMKLLNEAWQILSDPERRREYDAVRGGRADAETQEHFRRSTKTARECSTQYPSQWADFERWFQSVVNDFSTADYGDSWDTLEIKNSRSGWAFVKLGTICGGLFGIYLFFNSFDSFFARARRIAFCAGLGALVGKGLHYLIGSAFVADSADSRRDTVSTPPSVNRPVPEANGAPSPPPEQESSVPNFHLISCRNCQRMLRIPDPPPSDVVKCPSCGSRFELRAAR